MHVKLVLTINIILILWMAAMIVEAGEYHHHYSQPTQTTQQESNGVATAIAAGQHQFDASTFTWQGSIATGSYDNSTAFSFALAKRFKASLISGSVANEGGKIGYGMSLGFKF